jgi:hypothetical protein
MDEQKLATLCLEHIKPVIPDAKERYLGCTVLRTPISYPVFLNEYEKERQDFERSTKIENLLSIGRNGEFSHRFMEDVYWRTRKKVKKLIEANLELRENSPNDNLSSVPKTLHNRVA